MIARASVARRTMMAKRKTPAKAYLVYVTGGSESASYLLTDATLETFMGLRCIRGFYGSPGAKWNFIADRVVRIPCDRVQLIVEYDSYQAYKDAIKRHYEEKSQ